MRTVYGAELRRVNEMTFIILALIVIAYQAHTLTPPETVRKTLKAREKMLDEQCGKGLEE